jgi:hypothetical protein
MEKEMSQRDKTALSILLNLLMYAGQVAASAFVGKKYGVSNDDITIVKDDSNKGQLACKGEGDAVTSDITIARLIARLFNGFKGIEINGIDKSSGFNKNKRKSMANEILIKVGILDAKGNFHVNPDTGQLMLGNDLWLDTMHHVEWFEGDVDEVQGFDTGDDDDDEEFEMDDEGFLDELIASSPSPTVASSPVIISDVTGLDPRTEEASIRYPLLSVLTTVFNMMKTCGTVGTKVLNFGYVKSAKGHFSENRSSDEAKDAITKGDGATYRTSKNKLKEIACFRSGYGDKTAFTVIADAVLKSLHFNTNGMKSPFYALVDMMPSIEGATTEEDKDQRTKRAILYIGCGLRMIAEAVEAGADPKTIGYGFITNLDDTMIMTVTDFFIGSGDFFPRYVGVNTVKGDKIDFVIDDSFNQPLI